MSTFKEQYAKHYRDTKVSRGYNYHFIAIEPAVADKPTLLFLHGFPSHSNDWHYQVTHYHAKCVLFVCLFLGTSAEQLGSDRFWPDRS